MKVNSVVIIILNLNKKDDTLKCLESVYNMDYSSFEIIVVDNGSKDGSSAAIKSKFPNVNLLESESNVGVSGGRNFALNFIKEKFHFKYILLLDNDTIIDKKALSEMVKSFNSKHNIGIVTPKCYIMSSPSIINYAGGMSVNLYTGNISNIGIGEKDSGQFDKPCFIKSSGGLCIIRKDVINRVGIFDEKFNPYGWEDVDFSLRARRQGFKIYYNPDAIIYHKGGRRGRGAVEEYEYAKIKNYFYLIRKHANFSQLIVVFSLFPFKILKLITKELYRGEFKILSAQIKGFFSQFKRS
jgi:GT2 family glycosyltransferase